MCFRHTPYYLAHMAAKIRGEKQDSGVPALRGKTYRFKVVCPQITRCPIRQEFCVISDPASHTLTGDGYKNDRTRLALSVLANTLRMCITG